MSPEMPEVMTAPEVARIFHVSPMTVNRWARSGELASIIPFNPFRKRQIYRFRREEVQRKLDEAGLEEPFLAAV